MAMRNVDNLLHDDTQARLQAMTQDAAPSMPEPIEHSEPKQVDHKVEETDNKVATKTEGVTEEDTKNITDREQNTDNEQDNMDKVTDRELSSNLDPYGNELPPERTYTQQEVNEMIRDRLSRGRFAQEQQQYTPQQQQAVQQVAQDFQHDPNSSEDWETQLAQFIDNRLEQRETRAQTQAREQHEARVQAEFETKFTSGMGRYQDFAQVTSNKPITDAMMYAARAMEDPAAFIYNASKHHEKELMRISQLQDPFAQATEIGKLEATMRKVKTTQPSHKPLSQTKGDYAAGKKQEVKRSIDQLINADARKKFRR